MKKNSYSLLTMNQSSVTTFEYLFLFVLLFISFYWGFGSYALENMNEGLYGEIPREMLMNSSYYIIPHLNFIPYLEKPPLLYWLIALSYHLFGVSAWSARLIPVTAATFVCLSIFWFGKKVDQAKTGWLTAVILATSVGFILIARVIIFDMVLTAVFTLSLIFFYLWYQTESKKYLRISYFFLGLAFLTKGMVSVALVPIIAIIFMLINKTPWRKTLGLIDGWGILVFLAVTLPWLVTATLQQKGFLWDFFINEQVLRFLNKRIPDDYHHGPFYYYIPCVFVILLPWSLFLPWVFKKNKPQPVTQQQQLKKFLWVWFLVPFIFFSISQAKAQYYPIIGIPALAFLLGMSINHLINHASRALSINFIILYLLQVIVVGFTCLTFYSTMIANIAPYFFLFQPELALPLTLTWGAVFIYGLAGIFINWRYKNKPIVPFMLTACFLIPWIFFFVVSKQILQPERSAVAIGQYILAHDKDRPVYLYQDYENISSILYYTQKRIPIIDSASMDLFFGSQTPEAAGWFISNKEFAMRANQAVYVVLRNELLPQFNAAVLPLKFCKITQSGDVALLTNAPSECSAY